MDDRDVQFRELFNQCVLLLRSSGAAIADPELVVYHATNLRNLYDILLDRGFAAQEALDIVRACGISGPSAGQSSRMQVPLPGPNPESLKLQTEERDTMRLTRLQESMWL